MNNQPQLNLKGWGFVDAEILWNEGKLFKISFFHMTERKTNIFHFTEILNFNEIYIDKNFKIIPYETKD